MGMTGAQSQRIALAGGAGLTSFGMGLLAPVLPSYAQSLGASATLVGLLLASFGITRVLMGLLAPWFARRVGQHRLLVGSPAFTAPVAALCALVGGFWALALFCLLEGAAAAVYTTVGTMAIVSDAAPERRGRALATYQVAGVLGAAAGPAIGGLVGQQFGIRALFLLYAALAAIGAGWLHWRLDARAFTVPGELGRVMRKTGRPTWQLLADPGLLVLWLIAFALIFTRVGTQLVAAPLLGAWRLGLSPQQIGVALSLSGFAALAAFYPAGWLADRFGRKILIISGGLGMAGALALFATSRGAAAFLAAAVLLGLGSGLAGPAPAAYLADVLPVEDRTAAVGVYRAIGDVGAALAPPLLGWLADQGDYNTALFVAGGLLLAALSIFMWRAPANQSARIAATPSVHDTSDG